MIEGVIFDLDGTILNSKDLRVRAWKHAFETFGVDISGDEIGPLIGIPGVDLAGKFSPKAFAIEMEEERYFKSHLDEMELYCDVPDTFENLKNLGIKTAIVTSSRRALMNILNLPYEPIITIDDVEFGKPDPEAYLKALELIRVRPSTSMVVGDAETDLIPARKLGSVSVLIRHGNGNTSEYADYYLDEVSEVTELVKRLNREKK